MIWHTILAVAEQHKKSVIFVTGEEKSDWQIRSENQGLYPRYELIDEFRQQSNGASFHILSFSKFLDLFGVNENVVAEIRAKELLTHSLYSWSSTGPYAIAVKALYQWLTDNYPEQTVKPGSDDVDFEIIYSDGSRIGVETTMGSPLTESHLMNLVSDRSPLVKTKKYKNIILAIIVYGPNDLKSILNLVENSKTDAKLTQWTPDIAFLIGYVTKENKFSPVYFK